MSSPTPVIFRVDTATYLKSDENRTSIDFLLHLSAVVLMHGSRVKVPQKSTLHQY